MNSSGSRRGCFFIAKIALSANFAEFLGVTIAQAKEKRNKFKGLQVEEKLA